MLVYRQRKICNEAGTESPAIPDYWQKEIDVINAKNEAYRVEYEEKKNSFQMILQPLDSIFF